MGSPWGIDLMTYKHHEQMLYHGATSPSHMRVKVSLWLQDERVSSLTIRVVIYHMPDAI